MSRLLIALLGSGRRRIGREVGVTYAANTLGAILGSIAGGFGLIPLLTAQGVWRLVALGFGTAIVLAILAGLRAGSPRRTAFVPVAAGVVGLLLCAATGPTAFWRHTPIGAGRVSADLDGVNALRKLLNERRRSIVWEVDGVESSVALKRSDQYELMINGKSDGSAVRDSPTQVMSVLVGAMLHPDPKRALVIGLGTGSSSGWLAEVPTMQRVDTVEIEPAILRIADAMAPVNHKVLAHPKVHLLLADGRELLLTTPNTYDLIFSEPSNPYRAGISSLFTQEFYTSVTERLAPGGIFLQWLQGYDVDAQVVRTAYATLRSVFPSVETWQVGRNDLMLVASKEPLPHNLERVRARAAQEPYRSAMRNTWGVEGAEGFYAGFVAGPGLASTFQDLKGDRLSTDDQPLIEFGFGRSLGRQGLFDINTLRQMALSMKLNRPAGLEATLDGRKVDEMAAIRSSVWGVQPGVLTPGDQDFEARVRARQAYAQGNLQAAQALWAAQTGGPQAPYDIDLLAETLATAGDPRAPQFIEALRQWSPPEAEAMMAQLTYHQGALDQAAQHLEAAFTALRTNPWVYMPVVERALQLSTELGKRNPTLGAKLYAALGEPFSVGLYEELRLQARLELAGIVNFKNLCAEAIEPFEPNVPWEERFLYIRDLCYQQTNNPRWGDATKDLEAFRAEAPPTLSGAAGGQ